MESADENALIILVLIVVIIWLANLLTNYLEKKRHQPRVTLRMIINWGRNADAAIVQITKAYEWRIQQWSGFGNAILTAVLGFLSTIAISSFKQELKINRVTWLVTVIALLGLTASLQSYIFCQQTISRLKNEFLYLYNLLLLLKMRKGS